MVKNTKKGIFFLILSAFFFALMAVFIRLAGDLPSPQKAFFRNIVAFFIAGAMLLKKSEKIHMKKACIFPLIMRATLGSVGIFCNFYAIDHLVLSDASMLNKMSPFFAVIVSYFILKEKFTLSQGLAVFIAFIGGLFIVKPTFIADGNIDIIPAVIGLIGGIAAGSAYSFLRKLGSMGVQGPFVVLFFSAFSCLITVPYLIFAYEPMSLYQFSMLVCTGAVAAAGQFSITTAYYYAPAKEISVYDYTQLIFSTVFGFFIFGQTPDLLSIAGYIIIIAMAVWMFIYSRKRV